MDRVSLFKLAWPIFLEMLLMICLGVVDVYILSICNDAAAGAVEATHQILWNIFLLFVIVSSGTSILVAQNVGARNQEEIGRISLVSLTTNLVVGLLASALVLFNSKQILISMGISEVLFDYSFTYLKIVGGFMFLDALLLSSDAILKSHGYTKQCLIITASMNVVNVIGASLFGLGLLGMPALGVEGVAIATVVSKGVAICASFGFLFTRILKVDIFKHLVKFPVEELKRLFKVGFPSAMENMSYSLSQTLLMSIIIVNLGSEAYIARTYAWSICKFAFLFSLAIGQANLIMIGQLIGAKKFVQADIEGMKNFKISFLIACITGMIIFSLGRQFIGIFTTNANVVTLGALILAIDGFLEPGRTFNLVLINGLRGAGDVIYPVVIAIISMWSINVGLGYYLGVVLGYGLPGIWTAMLLDEWLRGLCMLYRWKSKAWMEKVLV